MVVFGFFSLVLVGVYWVNRAVALFDQLIGDGQSALVFLEFTALTLPNVIRLVLPISAFAAAVFVANRMTGESELVVMQATGFSGFRLARPVLYFGGIVAGMMLILTLVLVPASRTRLAERSAEIAQDVAARLLTEGTFLHPADGMTFYIREVTSEGELRDVFLSDARNPAVKSTYAAKRALLVQGETGPKLIMFDGLAMTVRAPGQRLFTTRFQNYTYDIADLVKARAQAGRAANELPTALLLAPSEAVLTETGISRATLLFEGHNRFAQPLTAIASALIGFCTLLLGGFSRFGLWRQMLGATVAIILVQLIGNAAANAALRDAALWPLAYLPALTGTALACGMLWLAGRPRRVRRAGAVAA